MITRRDFLKVTAAGGALASLGSVTEAKAAMKSAVPDEGFCHEGARKIPVIAEVDLVVAGGSSRAIAAAAAAAKAGSRVYLVGYMPYLGEDICGSHLYEREAGEKLQTALARKLFPGKNFPTPLHIKKTLEDELIDNNDPIPLQQLCNECADGPVRKTCGSRDREPFGQTSHPL